MALVKVAIGIGYIRLLNKMSGFQLRKGNVKLANTPVLTGCYSNIPFKDPLKCSFCKVKVFR